MTDEPRRIPLPEPEARAVANPRAIDPNDQLVAKLVESVNALGADSRYLVDALERFTRTLEPVQPSALSAEDRRYLVESGTYTAAQLDAAEREIDEGGFQLGILSTWIAEMRDTLSLASVAAFLDRSEEDVRQNIADRKLYAVEIADRLRFPAWQFSLSSPGKLLPHLEELIPFLEKRWDWISVSRFFATRQEDLVEEGKMTPAAWLIDGHAPDEVISLVEHEVMW